MLQYPQCWCFGFGHIAFLLIVGSVQIGLLEFAVWHWFDQGLIVGMHRYMNHRSHKNQFALQNRLPYP